MPRTQEITVSEAVAQIALTRKRHERPFFFMVGAGISSPQVPLAGAIVEACRKEVPAAERPDGPSDPMKEYSWWFQQAFPSPADRQWYLRKLIEKQFVSHSNLRLAHVMLSRKIANLVVTTNFDDFVSQSLTLFGEPHLVCDHPETIQRIDPDADDLQIVHVHGTYWFYDCVNLEGEIETRSLRSAQTAFSMGDFLDRVLINRSPIVLGYSGWAGDVFMQALERRLHRGLPYNIYWFCYQRGAIQNLPEFVRTHPNVLFVVPESPKSGPDGSRARLAQADEGVSAASAEPVLPARDVLDAMITGFHLEAPPLMRDPLQFFAGQLQRSLPQDDSGNSSRDIYLFPEVIRRIRRAVHSSSEFEKRLEAVPDAVRRSDYKGTIAAALAIRLDELGDGLISDEEIQELIEALILAAGKLPDGADEELDAYDRVLALGNDLLQRKPGDLTVQEAVAKALVNRGNLMSDEQEAARAYDEAIERFGGLAEPALRFQLARAIYNKGTTFDHAKKNQEAVDAYGALSEKFAGATDPRIRDLLAWAIYRQGVLYGDLGQSGQEAACYQRVVDSFSADKALDLPEVCSLALDALGDLQVSKGKEALLVKDTDGARRYFQAAEEFFNKALERAPENPYVMTSQAYLAFLQGNRERARELLMRAIPLGGEDLRSAELESKFVHPLPEDDEYRALVQSIPVPG